MLRTTSDTLAFEHTLLEKRKAAAKQLTAEKMGFRDWEHLYWNASTHQMQQAIDELLTYCFKK
jgi:hypothetical protein